MKGWVLFEGWKDGTHVEEGFLLQGSRVVIKDVGGWERRFFWRG